MRGRKVTVGEVLLQPRLRQASLLKADVVAVVVVVVLVVVGVVGGQ